MRRLVLAESTPGRRRAYRALQSCRAAASG
jgi:hypothetical protein